MNRYTIYCTEAQTRRALELGAPIKTIEKCGKLVNSIILNENEEYYTLAMIPTTEQMIGWLRKEKGLFCEPYLNGECRYSFSPIISTLEDGEIIRCEAEDSPEEATLAAIDAALEYLTNKK